MYIVSNVPPAIDKNTGNLEVYGGLAVVVLGSIPAQGATWAGITTNPKDVVPYEDRHHRVTRLPILIASTSDYQAHYAPWSKGKVYAAFHSLMEDAGLDNGRFAEAASTTEANYQSHLVTVADFGKKLAGEIKSKELSTGQPETIVVHDYQLIELGNSLRENGLRDNTIGFYLHIPFPPAEDFCKIPHAADIMQAYLSYDLLSFQENDYSRKNFIETVKHFYPDALAYPEADKLIIGDRQITVNALAASIDPQETLSDAIEGQKSQVVRDIVDKADGRKIVLSAGRFDIIKGFTEALAAVEILLDTSPDVKEDSFFVFNLQKTTYQGLDCYTKYQEAALEILGRIEDKHPASVHMLNGLPHKEMLGLMREVDVMYVPTIREGQNLVVKEFVIAQDEITKPGTVILTKGCGAYHGLKNTGGVFIDDARNVSQHVDALQSALTLPKEVSGSILAAQKMTVEQWTAQDYGNGLISALEASKKRSVKAQLPKGRSAVHSNTLVKQYRIS